MYSEQGLLELIGPVLGTVCQRWMVSSYCTPGSPQTWVPSAIFASSAAASTVSTVSPVVTAFSPNGLPLAAASMNASVTRTDWFTFWKATLP